MECEYCGKDRSSMTHIKERWMCDLCHITIFGKSNNDGYDRIWENGDITVWIKDDMVSSAWFDDGRTSIPESVCKGRKIEDVILFLLDVREQGKILCSDCGKMITKEEVKHSHFAGNFCSKCAERYKKQNSGECGLCGKPYYECEC